MLYYALTHQIELMRRKYATMIWINSRIHDNQNQAKCADNMYRSCVILHKPGHMDLQNSSFIIL